MITFVRMNTHVRYSVIVPVYNRPREVEELLESLTRQTYSNFEVLIVEDGSTTTCVDVYEKFTGKLNIRYFFKPNSGPGPSRNFGFENARGDYFVVFDSDCMLPPEYFSEVNKFISNSPIDAWGGPDKGHKDFSLLQKAMAFTMSSVYTTGGIRGGKKQLGAFQPRSFNMGMSKEVFRATGGFKFDRYAEDIELSLRIVKAGFKSAYIPGAFVYHKRRTSFKQFYQQVFNFGKGRVMVNRVHPGAIKLTHWFPSVFLLGILVGLLMLVLQPVWGFAISVLYLIYYMLISFEAYRATQSIGVSLLAGPSAFIQLIGYGRGFLTEMMRKSA